MSRQDLKELLLAATLSIATLFCIANVYLTQDLAPLLYGLTFDPRQDAAIMLLRQIYKQPEYADQLKLFKSIYGNKIESKVLSEQNLRQQRITHLELLLQKNPQARDALLKLAFIYYQENNIASASHCYNLAKQVDPLLFDKQLETLP